MKYLVTSVALVLVAISMALVATAMFFLVLSSSAHAAGVLIGGGTLIEVRRFVGTIPTAGGPADFTLAQNSYQMADGSTSCTCSAAVTRKDWATSAQVTAFDQGCDGSWEVVGNGGVVSLSDAELIAAQVAFAFDLRQRLVAKQR